MGLKYHTNKHDVLWNVHKKCSRVSHQKDISRCRDTYVVVVDAVHFGGAYEGTFVSASTLDGAGMTVVILI